ncbi:MAG: hypothetical protein ACFFFC_12085 [Candidatus Thorarchaeota archaeon]
MGREWINLYVDQKGTWQQGQPYHYKSAEEKKFDGVKVRIHETSVGGAVLLSSADGNLTSYGIAEVYLKIFFKSEEWRYLSAPLSTPIDLTDVTNIELNILIPIGNANCTKITYCAYVNAHCVYELIK